MSYIRYVLEKFNIIESYDFSRATVKDLEKLLHIYEPVERNTSDSLKAQKYATLLADVRAELLSRKQSIRRR